VSDDDQLPVRVDVGLKAEAKLELKGEVPSGSLGRLVDAVTDSIRPFTESRGLKADLLRLQREGVAMEITRRAQARLAVERAGAQAVPAKVLVPLLERGSCEDPSDDTMIDRWANLLAAASMKLPVQPRFVGILGELAGSQAECLEEVAFGHARDCEFPYVEFADAPLVFAEEFANREMRDLVSAVGRDTEDYADIGNALVDLFSGPGRLLSTVIVDLPKGIDEFTDEAAREVVEGDLAVLESLGLVRRVHLRHDWMKRSKRFATFVVYYYHLTSLGGAFCEVCCREKVHQLQGLTRLTGRRRPPFSLAEKIREANLD
jgi:hypothetical protein